MSNQRDALERDRDLLEAAISRCESMRDLPALIREHRAVIADLERLPNELEISHADEIAKRRAARRGDAADQTHTGRGTQQRR